MIPLIGGSYGNHIFRVKKIGWWWPEIGDSGECELFDEYSFNFVR